MPSLAGASSDWYITLTISYYLTDLKRPVALPKRSVGRPAKVVELPELGDPLIRKRAEEDLAFFISTVHPLRVLGHCHKELIRWMTRKDKKSHQLVLMPRDHQKSALAAYWVAWRITKNPALRVLYVSATSTLATKQLKFIKDILTSETYRKYWPEMVNEDEGKREKWTETEISVDHPERKKEAIRDATIFTAGLTTVITGLHCDISVLDDVVIDDNAYTKEGRDRVSNQCSYLASIAGTEGEQLVVGTRYHPIDEYNSMLEQLVEIYDEKGAIVESYPLYELWERTAESNGDGTGEYLWPRTKGPNGKWYGFNQSILATKRAQYKDKAKFRAQYYNQPNSEEDSLIKRESFQYYDKNHLHKADGKWYYRNNRLNVFAAIDFAYSLNRKADYTCITTVGVDGDNNYYVLDIDRFKTNLISDYYEHILHAHMKWGFRKLRVEMTAAQSVIVEDLKLNYIKKNGLALVLDECRPSQREGSKEERINATLQPRYANRQIWHYVGGNCELLEEELVQSRPAHDDIKDSLAACVVICIAPTANVVFNRMTLDRQGNKPVFYNSRFGGF